MNTHELELRDVLMELGYPIDEAGDLAECPEVWDIPDEEYFHDLMGDVELNYKNIVQFYKENPNELQNILECMFEERYHQTWNSNVWRNSR